MATLEVKGFTDGDYTLPIDIGGGHAISDRNGVHWAFVKSLTYCYHGMNINGRPLRDDFTINDTLVRKIVLKKREHISGSQVYNFRNGQDNFHIKIKFQTAQNTLVIESEGLPRSTIGNTGAYRISGAIIENNYIDIV